MRFFANDLTRVSNVTYYFALDDAEQLPYYNKFASGNYADRIIPPPNTLGEANDFPRNYYNGFPTRPWLGHLICTGAGVWRDGADVPGPVYDEIACCDPPQTSFLEFNGTTDFAVASDVPLPDASSPMSIFCWVRSHVTTQGIPVFYGTVSIGNAIALSCNGPSGNFFAVTQIGAGIVGTTPLTNDTWFHFGFTWDGTTPRMYVNGVEEGAIVGSWTQSIIKDGSLYIGKYSGGFELDGSVDDVRIYDVTLSLSEIAELYSFGHGIIVAGSKSANLVTWYKCDEGSGNILEDSSGFGNDATITGATFLSGGVVFP